MAIYNVASDVWGYPQPLMRVSYSGPYSELLKQAQAQYEAARAANEQRYMDILRGYRERYDQAMQMLQGLGSQAKSDILSRVLAKQNEAIADLVGRGLGSSTILPSIKAGYQREAENAIGRLEESLRQQRLATHGQLSGDVLGFMERRKDEYPNLAQIYDIIFRGEQAKAAAANSYSYRPPSYAVSGFVMSPSSRSPNMLPFAIPRGYFANTIGVPSIGFVGLNRSPGYFIGRGYSPRYV